MRNRLPLAFAFCLLCSGPVRAAEGPRLDVLIRDLQSADAGRKVQAAEALGKIGPLAAPAVGALVAALSDKNPEVQFEALLALEQIGPAARAAVPELGKLLKGAHPGLHKGAIDVLGSIGRDAAEAIPALVPFLESDDEAVRTAAATALARILSPKQQELREAVEVLAKSLGSARPPIRDEAIVGLGLCGPAAVPALIDLIKHADSADQIWPAATALGMIGREAREAVPVLTGALGSRAEKVQIHAAYALGAIGPEAKAAVPALSKLLVGGTASVRVHVANALGNLGPAAADAVGDLQTALTDQDPAVRREAADALGKIGPAGAAASGGLVAALDDGDGSVAIHAAHALGRMGPKVIPELLPALKDPQRQHLAVMVLQDLGPAAKTAAKPLGEILGRFGDRLSEADRDFCREVILALAHIGPEAKGAAPALMKILDDEQHPLRAGAAWALAKMGDKGIVPILKRALASDDQTNLQLVAPTALMLLEPGNEEYVRLALPRLIAALDHEVPLVRREVVLTLATLGPRAEPAVDKLAAALSDPDPIVRNGALTALAAIGPASARALPAILEQLAARQPPMLYSAVFAIGRIGPAATAAIPVLEKNLEERDAFLPIVSAWALVHVDPKRVDLAKKCLEPLSRALQLPDPRVRREAAQALALLGPAAGPARPALEAAAKDGDETVRKAAADALEKIGK